MFAVMKVHENQADNQGNGKEERESCEGGTREECLCVRGKGAEGSRISVRGAYY